MFRLWPNAKLLMLVLGSLFVFFGVQLFLTSRFSDRKMLFAFLPLLAAIPCYSIRRYVVKRSAAHRGGMMRLGQDGPSFRSDESSLNSEEALVHSFNAMNIEISNFSAALERVMVFRSPQFQHEGLTANVRRQIRKTTMRKDSVHVQA